MVVCCFFREWLNSCSCPESGMRESQVDGKGMNYEGLGSSARDLAWYCKQLGVQEALKKGGHELICIPEITQETDRYLTGPCMNGCCVSENLR